MNRLLLMTLVLLILIAGNRDASAARWRRHQNRVAPLAATSAVEPSAKPRSPELQRLYELRVEAAEKQYEYVKIRFKGGALGFKDVVKAQTQLHEAAFAAATTPEWRLRVLENSVQLAKTEYEFILAAIEHGAGSELDRVAAMYALLTAEIRLAEEKDRQAASKRR